jgi:23S rRNA (guanosine2251-2'-O)-methyltransferase
MGAGLGQRAGRVNSKRRRAGIASGRGACHVAGRNGAGGSVARKPAWAIERERERSREATGTVWLFGLHAVRDALLNPARERHRLVVTRNAAERLADAIAASGMRPEIADPRRFDAPLDPQSVHQGAALEVAPLAWGSVSEVCAPHGTAALVLLLDRVTDPHNVGAILRSAEVFGARAVIAPRRHAAPETGALAKAASGALERQPYLRVPNLAGAMGSLRAMGYAIVGLDGAAEAPIGAVLRGYPGRPLALALGAEGPGMRELTGRLCDRLARIPAAGGFGSLNVSNAAAVALYAASQAGGM